MKPWREKANNIIDALCMESYLQANTRKDGKPYKKHRGYSVPLLAEQLVECLDTDDEIRAKTLFLSYDGMEVTKSEYYKSQRSQQ